MQNIAMNFKKLNPKAIKPTYGTPYSAGADLYACMDGDVIIPPHSTALINTGLAFEIPEGLVGLVYARSGLATRRSLAPANKVGVIDCDYRGEIIVALHNHGDKPQTISPGDRVAQFVLTPYVMANFNETNELSYTVRGAGGFGSTGTK